MATEVKTMLKHKVKFTQKMGEKEETLNRKSDAKNKLYSTKLGSCKSYLNFKRKKCLCGLK